MKICVMHRIFKEWAVTTHTRVLFQMWGGFWGIESGGTEVKEDLYPGVLAGMAWSHGFQPL